MYNSQSHLRNVILNIYYIENIYKIYKYYGTILDGKYTVGKYKIDYCILFNLLEFNIELIIYYTSI